MPKLAKSEQQKRDDNFRAVISANLERVHLNRTTLGKRCGMSPKMMTARWSEPDRFTRGEMRKMCNVLNISMNTLMGSETS